MVFYIGIRLPEGNIEDYSIPQTTGDSYDNMELRIGSGGWSADGQIRNILLVDNSQGNN